MTRDLRSSTPGRRSLRTKGLVIGGSIPLPYEGYWPDEIPIKHGEYHNFVTKLTSQHNCGHFRWSADTMQMLPKCHILRSPDDLDEGKVTLVGKTRSLGITLNMNDQLGAAGYVCGIILL